MAHYHVVDWDNWTTPIAPIVDPDGETVEYMSWVKCVASDRVMVCWVTSIGSPVRSRVKIGYSADVDTFLTTPGSVTTATTLFRSTTVTGGGRGVVHAGMSIGPDGYPWLIVCSNSPASLVTDDSVTSHPMEPSGSSWTIATRCAMVAYRTRNDGDTWEYVQWTLAGPLELEANYPLTDSTFSNGIGASGWEDRVGAIEYNWADVSWGSRLGIVKGMWFGTQSGSALYLLPTYIPSLFPRVNPPTTTEWGVTRLVAYFPDRRCDNGFAANTGTTWASFAVSPSAPTTVKYGFVFHTEAPLIVGRESHGLWATGRTRATGDTSHHINIAYGSCWNVGGGIMDYTVNGISNVGNNAGVSATFTSGPIQNAVSCSPRYGRIIRHAPGGTRTLSIFLPDSGSSERLGGDSLVMLPWTDADEVVGGSAVVPPADWIEAASVTGWSTTTGRQMTQAYAYPLCDYLIVSSADEITATKIRTCFPPRRLHLPYKKWWDELDEAEDMEQAGESPLVVSEQRRRAYEHAHQNWEIMTRWCNDVWLKRQIHRAGCPIPEDYTETGPFHPPHSHPREPVQFEENYLALERWARPENVCWSGGLHIANKRVLEREEQNLLGVERWANTMTYGLQITAGCVSQ